MHYDTHSLGPVSGVSEALPEDPSVIAFPTVPFYHTWAITFSLRPGQVDEPGLEKRLSLTSSETLPLDLNVFVEKLMKHMLGRDIEAISRNYKNIMYKNSNPRPYSDLKRVFIINDNENNLSTRGPQTVNSSIHPCRSRPVYSAVSFGKSA